MNCSSSVDTCTACKDSSNRILSENCACKDGSFEDGVSICGNCSFKCETCDNDTTCLTCADTNRKEDDGG